MFPRPSLQLGPQHRDGHKTGWKLEAQTLQGHSTGGGKVPPHPGVLIPWEEKEGFWREANDIPPNHFTRFRTFLLEKRGGSGCSNLVEMTVQ